jgi:hypothetical protein
MPDTTGPTGAPFSPSARVADPVQEAEAALKAYRQAGDEAARRRAGEALERAVKKLRQHRQPGAGTGNGASNQ